jgi:hypothetical protein
LTVQIQEEGALLHGVGAMGDDNTIDIIPFRYSLIRLATFSRISKLISCEPILEICSPLDIRQVLDARNAIDHGVDTHSTRCVARLGSVAAAPAMVPPVARIVTFGLRVCPKTRWSDEHHQHGEVEVSA